MTMDRASVGRPEEVVREALVQLGHGNWTYPLVPALEALALLEQERDGLKAAAKRIVVSDDMEHWTVPDGSRDGGRDWNDHPPSPTEFHEWVGDLRAALRKDSDEAVL